MKFSLCLLFLTSAADGFAMLGNTQKHTFTITTPSTPSASTTRIMSTTDAEAPTEPKGEEKAVEGKKAPKDAPPTNIGWNSHEAVVSTVLCCYCNWYWFRCDAVMMSFVLLLNDIVVICHVIGWMDGWMIGVVCEWMSFMDDMPVACRRMNEWLCMYW